MEEETSQTNNNSLLIVAVAVVIFVLGISIILYRNNQRSTVPQINQAATANNASDQNNQETPSANNSDQTGLTVTLNPDPSSGSTQTGTATLTEVDGKVQVSINVSDSGDGVLQPAHIHTGACPNPGKIIYPLNGVAAGKSETTLDVSMQQLLNQLPLAINIHKSKEQIDVYTACGDITQ